jgi:arylsulfatase A-like enzyme
MIPAGSVCSTPAANLDLFPTCLSVAGLSLPEDRVIDGRDITSLLTGGSQDPPHDHLYLYHQGELEGVRSGRWKYFRETSHYTWPMPTNKKLGWLADHTDGPLPLLYDLNNDPGEAYNLAHRFPGKVEELEAALSRWEAEMDSNPLGFLR